MAIAVDEHAACVLVLDVMNAIEWKTYNIITMLCVVTLLTVESDLFVPKLRTTR